MDFFNIQCQEPTIKESLFGLCDDQNGLKAYINLTEKSKWIATVKNNNTELIFTAIDKCVIKDDEEKGRGRCDCMLTSTNHIYFIELKNELRNWKTDAIEQLKSTIQFFIANHNVKNYKYKKAFACNKKQPRFQEIDNELNLYFFRTYGFRIDAQTEIIVL